MTISERDPEDFLGRSKTHRESGSSGLILKLQFTAVYTPGRTADRQLGPLGVVARDMSGLREFLCLEGYHVSFISFGFLVRSLVMTASPNEFQEHVPGW